MSSPKRSPRQPNRQPSQDPQPVDTLLLGSLRLNAERPGRCAQCQRQTTARRILRTGYIPPALNRRELDHLSRGDMSEAAIVDSYLQRCARRQLKGDFGDEKRMAICAACASRWLADALADGPGLVSIPGTRADTQEAVRSALALMTEALTSNAPLFAGVVWRIERGPDGRSQASVVLHRDGPIAPQILIRAQDDMRRYAREYGRSIF